MFEKFLTKVRKFFYFHLANPVIRKGEAGGYRFVFRRFYLTISTLSGNFKARFTAAENPYGYLLAGEDDQTHGFAERLYMMGMLLTTDQQLVTDIDKALTDYGKRLDGKAEVVEDETEEKVAIQEVKDIQDFVEASPKEQRKMERDSNGRFKKRVKDAQKGPNGDV